MASKTYKIGETAYYGIWKVSVSKTKVLLQGIDYSTKEVQETRTFRFPQKGTYNYNSSVGDTLNEISKYLNDNMSYYYAEKIEDYIKTKIGISE